MMKRKPAVLMFLGICMILAVLLLTKAITPLISGCVFAPALALLGGQSKGIGRQ